MNGHVALLGDSVFDNGAYTRGAPDVAAHVRTALGERWRVTLLAVDGTTTTDIGSQLDRISRDASHLLLSLGGNDALLSADLLDTPVRSTGEALDLFRGRLDAFETTYGYVLEALAALDRRLVVCTIYNGNLDEQEAGRARVALMLFNDVIMRGALGAKADLLELRAICRAPDDFANPIEPSGSGGQKIAHAIAAAVRLDRGTASRLLGAAGGA